MSSIVAAIYLWLFTLGLVTSQPWLFVMSLLVLAVSIWLFRDRGSKAILLLSAAGTGLVLAFNRWPISPDFHWDPFTHVRKQVLEQIVGVTPDASALVLGLSIGDASLVSQSLESAMKLTSLTHLMAVSGANCAIVIGSVYFLLNQFGIRTRVGCSIFALCAYVGLVGFQPSVLRASAMAVAVLIALNLGRKVNPLAALALSVLFLISISPSLAINYGFALSVLATAGILIIAPRLYTAFALKMPRWIAMGLAVSAGAQLFCFPVLLGLQGGVPTYSLLANLLCEPLVAPITVLGLIAVALVWCQPIAGVFFWLASLAAWPIAQVAMNLAEFPFATMPWRIDVWGVLAAALLVIAVLSAIFSKRLANKNLSWLTVAVLIACSFGVVINQAVKISLWPMANWQVASCDVGQGDATVIRSDDSIAVVDVGKDGKKIDSCLAKLGVVHIDLLVLTHFDADHVNGLAGAIKNRLVGNAMLTSFADARPGADFSRFLLETNRIRVIKAEQGLHGEVGTAGWKVLSPSRTAEEAEDSNDGSVTMLWKFSNFQLITLADLGEKGQQRLAASLGSWWTDPNLPLVMKVSHHGSADQYPELIEWLKPTLALISVGANNGYGHPTRRTLNTLNRAGATILRTDLLGSIALGKTSGEFEVSYSGSS